MNNLIKILVYFQIFINITKSASIQKNRQDPLQGMLPCRSCSTRSWSSEL